jgi:hypothetical protein
MDDKALNEARIAKRAGRQKCFIRSSSTWIRVHLIVAPPKERVNGQDVS